MDRRASSYLQRSLVLLHVGGLALFFGGTAAVLVTVLAGERAGKVGFAFELAWQLQNAVLLPGAIAILVSGVLLSLTGPWGFIRHWWMVLKLLGSGVMAVHSQVEYRPLTGRLLEALRSASPELPEGFSEQLFHYHRVGVIQLAVLAVLSAVALFKPWGKSWFGVREKKRGQATFRQEK